MKLPATDRETLTDAQRRWRDNRKGMFKLVAGQVGLLDGCPTECPVHEYGGDLYVNTGPLFRLMTPDGDAYQDDMGRRWTIAGKASGDADEHCCPICARAFEPADLCSTDIELGTCHAACLEGSPTVDLDSGEPVNGPILAYRYDDDVAETIEANPKSWIAWKREAERLRAAIEFAHAEGFSWPSDPLGALTPPKVGSGELDAADEAQMALCQLDWLSSLPGAHPHRVECIRLALERLAAPVEGVNGVIKIAEEPAKEPGK